MGLEPPAAWLVLLLLLALAEVLVGLEGRRVLEELGVLQLRLQGGDVDGELADVVVLLGLADGVGRRAGVADLADGVAAAAQHLTKAEQHTSSAFTAHKRRRVCVGGGGGREGKEGVTVK